MKRILPIIGLCASSAAAFGQLPVSTAAENKNVVLEEFTGITCTFCPDGHLRANQLAAQNPGDVVLINIHTGGFASPTGPGTDFRTSWGTAIAGQTGLTGYPAGTVNRRNFAGSEMGAAGTTAMGRGDWAPNAPTVLGEASYVNVALEAEIDAATRELTVDVEVYETGTAPATYNLNVALLQSNVEGPQTGSSANPSQVLPNGNYLHNHMLRELLTGQWGDVINSNSGAGTITRQYTWTLPADINDVDLTLGNLEVVAFIAEGQQNIVTGAEGPVTYTNLANDDAQLSGLEAPAVVCGTSMDAQFTLTNNGGNAMTAATIEYGFSGQTPQTLNWTGNLASFDNEVVDLTGVTVPGGAGTFTATVTAVNGGTDANAANNAENVTVAVTSDQGEGADYTVTMVQDRYGSEITWTVKDENGTTVASGGPYSDLSASGTQTHTSNFTASATGCFEMEVLDSYGDGINSGYGNGSYKIENAVGAVVITSNGTYTSSENKPFEIISLTTSVTETGVSGLNVYPNPTSNVATIEFDATNAENASLVVLNSIGEVVKSNFNVANGFNRITVDCSDLASGVYMINISGNGQNSITKFNVVK